MGEASRALEIVDSAVSEAVARGVAHLTAEDERLDGRWVRLGARPRLNFSSCSYLGLELDPRVKRGAIEATERYGTQFSSSRTYISAPLYEELEALLREILGGPVLVAPNTTLGHLSTLPVLVGEEDAVILDHQVHHTVQLALPQLRQQGTHVEFVRHGRLDRLEERIRDLRRKHRRIWYMIDGIYSMYGHFAPMDALNWLLLRHEELHLYVDDAHGMSWTGRFGRGFALEHLHERERAVVAVSLNKAFGAAGGAVVFPDEESARRVRTCGGPMIFTGPVQPPMLGAAIASARIHLSDEMPRLQAELLDRIRFANRRARELDLPLVSGSEVPIRYVGLGLPPAAYDMTAHLLERGIYANCAVFPAVAPRCSGLRFIVTRHQSEEDIDELLRIVAGRFPESLRISGGSRADLERAFHLTPTRRVAKPEPEPGAGAETALRCQHETTVRALDPQEWDRLLGARGSFGWEGLRFLERAFGDGAKPEDRWHFHYFVVRESDGRPVLATFFTEALWKDDMVADSHVSKAVEARRTEDPYFLTSRVLGMGSLLTEGDHLWLDRSRDWRAALSLLLDAVSEEADACEAGSVALRDLPADDPELDAALRDAGFAAVDAPVSFTLEVDWSSWDEHLARLSQRARRFQRREVEPGEGTFECRVYQAGACMPSEVELAHFYRLYQNVQQKSYGLNTFPLPESIFARMLEHPCWEIFSLRLRPEFGGKPDSLPQAVLAGYVGREQYAPVVPGLDYRFVRSHGAYRQLMREMVRRAEHHGARRIFFGMGARLEKERFGAVPVRRRIYVQPRDLYRHDVLSLIAAEAQMDPEGAG